MRTTKLGMLGAGFAMALASLASTAPKASFVNREITYQTQQEQTKALAAQLKAKHRVVRENVGGLDLVQKGEYGMSPMEYGMRFGNGKSRKGKTNFNKLAHNAKLRRA